MPRSKFVVTSKIQKSFRTEKIKGMFDVDKDEITKEFDVDIPIESKNWNIGLIVGASGTGKTTIAKEVFKDFDLFKGFEWSGKAVVDDFDEKLGAKEITESLSKVGFSSPPDWLKPFAVLSNGQKMRVELARLILESDRPVIYDEFTSVVDRQVAQIGSSAIQKFIRKNNKQFIAVSCHYDIEKWLEPDWVYDVNKKEFYWGSLRRPEIKVDIRKARSSEWELFKEFHYLSSKHNNSAHCYIAEINNTVVGWCSVLHFPHSKVKNMKRVHRVVILPDYQGIGIGTKFLNKVGDIYREEKKRFTISTSTPVFIHALRKSSNWIMTRKPSRVSESKGVLSKSVSNNRLTASFEYIG